MYDITWDYITLNQKGWCLTVYPAQFPPPSVHSHDVQQYSDEAVEALNQRHDGLTLKPAAHI